MDPVSLTAGVVAAIATYALAYRRKGRVGSVQIGAMRIELHSAAEPSVVFDTIAAIGPPYRVDDLDPDKLMLVLSARPSIWSYGWLFPVNVLAEDTGSRIEIGIKSRLLHIGPGTGRAHKWCAQAIERLLTVPPARMLSAPSREPDR